MRLSANIAIDGGPELARALYLIGEKAQARLTTALRRVARPIVQQAALAAPVRTGLLRRSMGVEIRSYRRSGVALAVIGARRTFSAAALRRKGGAAGKTSTPANYAHLVEFGTRPHAIAPKGASTLYRRQERRMHPGAKPKPFLRPAFGAYESSIVNNLLKELEEVLDKALGVNGG